MCSGRCTCGKFRSFLETFNDVARQAATFRRFRLPQNFTCPVCTVTGSSETPDHDDDKRQMDAVCRNLRSEERRVGKERGAGVWEGEYKKEIETRAEDAAMMTD